MAPLVPKAWRCWWQRPVGHVDEVLDYVDGLSGRWTARIRCVRCGRETGVRVGELGNRGPENPMSMLLPRQAARALPAPKRPRVGPNRGPGQVEVLLPDGTRVAVRALAAHLTLRRQRTVYLATAVGGRPVVSGNLRGALARACRGVDEGWLDRTARQLEAELPVRS